MAILLVDVVSATVPMPDIAVRAELTDERGTPMTGFATGDEAIVLSSVARTDANGEASLDLTPNADITPAGSYYTVTVGPKSFLITKSSGTENLADALV